MKREMEALVTEFNRTAARNIELIDDRIQALQDAMKKADAKMGQLDGRIERANNPIVIEKVVREKPEEDVRVREKVRTLEPEARPREKIVERKAVPTDFAKVSSVETDDGEDVYVRHGRSAASLGNARESREEEVRREPREPEVRQTRETVPEPEPVVETVNRSDQLKALLRDGKSKEELIEMGYRENEINLFSFLIGKNV
jgi:hypothetical protein